MARNRNPLKEYAMYRGDTFLDMGTAKELAKKFDITVEAIRHYSAPSYRKRIAGNEENRLIVIVIEND